MIVYIRNLIRSYISSTINHAFFFPDFLYIFELKKKLEPRFRVKRSKIYTYLISSDCKKSNWAWIRL